MTATVQEKLNFALKENFKLHGRLEGLEVVNEYQEKTIAELLDIIGEKNFTIETYRQAFKKCQNSSALEIDKIINEVLNANSN